VRYHIERFGSKFVITIRFKRMVITIELPP